MAYTAENWPITAALLQFPGTDAQAGPVHSPKKASATPTPAQSPSH